MIASLAIGLLFGAVCLAMLASPWPFLAPFVVLGIFALALLYRRPGWGVLGLAMLVPIEGLFTAVDFSAAKLLGASMILILSMQVLQRQIAPTQLRSNLWRPLILLLLCVLLSLLFSENLPVSLDNLRELAIGLVMFPITLLVARYLNLWMLCRIIALSVAATCIVALISTSHQVEGRAIGLLQDANYFALLIAVAAPLASLLALRAPQTLSRLFWVGVTLLLLAGMTKTDSRSGLLVLLLSAAIGVWHHRARLQFLRPRHLGFAMLGSALVLPLALAVVPADYIERIQSLSMLKSGVNAHQDASLGRRASYLLVGSTMIQENPLLGSGPGVFPVRYALTGYAKAFSEDPQNPDLYRRAHNTYLELFSEMGIPAGLLFISLLVLGLRNFERARQAWLSRAEPGHADLATHLGLSLLAMALFMLFISAPNHKYLWMFLALSSAVRLQAESECPRR